MQTHTKNAPVTGQGGIAETYIDLDDQSLLFYDIECFKCNSLLVFKNIKNEEIAYFWCSLQQDFDSEAIRTLIKGKTLVGYNNYFYDDTMLSAFLRGVGQRCYKRTNDILIGGGNPHVTRDEDIVSIDCFQQIDVSMPSLKKIEGNMGRNIFESAIPFGLDRELTEEEKQETLEYCRYDVEQTIEVFKLRRKQYFDTKNQLLQLSGNTRLTRLNTTTISASILLKKPLPKWNELRLLDKKQDGSSLVPPEVWVEWMRAEKENDKPKKITVKDMGCTYVFGGGGLHGVADNGIEFYNVKLLDVGSMYPSIIILLEALQSATAVYDQIRKDRLAIKHVDKIKSNALKLILNSVYGNLKNEHSILYNPLASLSVCVYGQMALFDLCKKLDAAGYQVVNANTDGVAFVPKDHDPDCWEEIQHEWEQDWGLYLELDEFDWWLQKDVNNYIAIKDGHVKVKGGETKKYPFAPEKGVHSFFSNNDCRILHICLVEYILAAHAGKRPSLVDIMIDHLDQPILFQYVLKAGSTYKGVVDAEGNMLQKVNRVFAVKKGVPSTKLYKLRQDDGLVNFPDTPERMLIWNDDVDKLENFASIVDINHYVNLARKKLKGWGFQT